MKPKYFSKEATTTSSCSILYATYEHTAFYAGYTSYAPGIWYESETLNTGSFINDPDYAPVSWRDIKDAYPFHLAHKLAPINDSVKEQQQTEATGIESAT